MGKGSGKAKTPKEAQDNLKSHQQLSIIDLLEWQHIFKQKN
ncbi:hypothetical protein [Gilliamella sp. Choc5-1]|nr:hypothetical protein [Gilliamella apicola]